jgi:hypothetical protein
MEVKEVLAHCRRHGAVLTPEGNSRLRIESPKPLPSDLLEELREHKGEVLALLALHPRWDAESIAQAVAKEGCCIFWSDLLGGPVALVKDDTWRDSVPAGLVTYTSEELGRLLERVT